MQNTSDFKCVVIKIVIVKWMGEIESNQSLLINQQLNSCNTNRFYFARGLQKQVDVSAAVETSCMAVQVLR